jgi:hypothetical protein
MRESPRLGTVAFPSYRKVELGRVVVPHQFRTRNAANGSAQDGMKITKYW